MKGVQSSLSEFSRPDPSADLSDLTARQREMYEAVERDGRSIRAVARDEDLNPGTVAQHVYRALEKLEEGSP